MSSPIPTEVRHNVGDGPGEPASSPSRVPLARPEGKSVQKPLQRRSNRLKAAADTSIQEVEDVSVSSSKAAPAKNKMGAKKRKADEVEREVEKSNVKSEVTKEIPNSNSKSTSKSNPPSANPIARQYWLMKAEPESRLEKGHDVRFSIDDLASKKEPEPWDGIRNPSARNNLRAMKKGDLAFFYHSNCKVPAIVGVMEIVREHSPDLTARDSKAAYYDPKDTGDEPKWSVVHVEFRRKLKEPITLKELREWGVKGGELESMQMLKMGRLSVSKVSEDEWVFLSDIIDEREGS